MRALQRFEDWVSDTLEGRLGAALGGRLQPADIARRIGEAMDDHRTAGAVATYAPNRYRAFVAPAVHARLVGFQAALEEELATFAATRGAESGYRFVGRPRVTLLSDPGLRRDQVRVEVDMVGEAADALDTTRPVSLGPVGTSIPRPLALTAAGRAPVVLQGDEATVGRALDNDVILPDASVSRHHARLIRRGAYWLLEDLASTHGSFVNGHRVTQSLLRDGDQLRLGTLVLHVEQTT